MEINKFPMLIVGVVVALVLAGATLPVFFKITEETDTIDNQGVYNINKIESINNITINWDHTTPDVINVNGDVVELPSKRGDWTIFGASDYLVRLYKSNTDYLITMFASGSSINASRNAEQDFILTMVDKTLNGSVTGSETALTFTTQSDYSFILTDNEDSEYVMKDPNTPAYILRNSEINSIVIGRTANANKSCGLYFEYTPDSDVEIQQFFGPTATFDNFNVASSNVDGYVDLIKLDCFTFSITQDNDSVDATYNYFIIPSKVIAEKSIHPDTALTVMLNIIPLLAIAGLVVGSIAWFITRK